jgi:hypothetical protein
MAYEQKSYAMAQRQALRERPTVAGSAPSARASMAKRNRHRALTRKSGGPGKVPLAAIDEDRGAFSRGAGARFDEYGNARISGPQIYHANISLRSLISP